MLFEPFTVIRELTALDHAISSSWESLRWGPATASFALVSAWWVKGPLMVVVAGIGDIASRRLLPAAAACAGISFALASVLNLYLKDLFDRARPPLANSSIDAAVAVPASPSFPSGHTMSAFAVAAAVAFVYPKLRWPMLGLAAAIGLSRIYLGVHFTTDVLAGAVLGAMVGVAVAWTLETARRAISRAVLQAT